VSLRSCGCSRLGRGFTLLEVLVAIAILGLSLTVILSSQVGLFAGVKHGRNLSFATNLARCRMAEVEVDLLKNGYPLIDQADEGACCDDEPDSVYDCSWRIERVELPDPPLADDEDPLGMLGGIDGGPGPLSALQELQTNGAAALTGDGGISGLTGLFAESGEVGVGGLAPMVMTTVYPSLKPMLEASIRKITVTVRWKEGQRDRELSVVQYVTNPVQGGFDPYAAEQLEQFNEGSSLLPTPSDQEEGP
jgi:general secretion pathway protein I